MNISVETVVLLDQHLARLQREARETELLGPAEVEFIELCNIQRQMLAHHLGIARSARHDLVEEAFLAAASIREIADDLESSAINFLRTQC